MQRLYCPIDAERLPGSVSTLDGVLPLIQKPLLKGFVIVVVTVPGCSWGVVCRTLRSQPVFGNLLLVVCVQAFSLEFQYSSVAHRDVQDDLYELAA